MRRASLMSAEEVAIEHGPRQALGKSRPRYTASLMDWKLKSRVLIGGTTMAAPMSPDSDALTRIARPIASRFLSMAIGLSLKRKFLTGWLILPFSIKKVPSRVRPV